MFLLLPYEGFKSGLIMVKYNYIGSGFLKYIIFIPGIMGTELFEGGEAFKKPIKRWINPDIRYLNRVKLDEKSYNTVTPGNPMKYGLTLFKGSIEKFTVYKDILSSLEILADEDTKIIPFGYDWRKEIIKDIVPKLHKRLESLKGEEVIIVAHSMGGLVTKSYIEWCKENNKSHGISKVITLATPWKGSPRAYQVLKYGLKLKQYLPSIEVARKLAQTFPSVYQLLPSEQFCRELLYVRDSEKLYNWSESFDQLYLNNDLILKNGKDLNKSLYDFISPPWPSDIEHINMVGVTQGTLGIVNTNKLSKYIHKDIGPLDGDGTVPLYSALPNPSWDDSKVYYVEANHQGIVLHKETLNLINNIILGEIINLNSISESYTPKRKWSYTKIDCPVDVYYSDESSEINSSINSITKIYLGDTKYLIHNSEESKQIEIEAYDEGYTQVETVVVDNLEVESVYKFKTIEADPSLKAVVKIDFEESEPIPSLELEERTLENEKTVKTIEGRKIETQKPEKELPINTTINYKELGERNGSHFDYKGLEILLSVENNSNVLDTYYRINESDWKLYSNSITVCIENNYEPGRNKIEFYSEDVFGNKETYRKDIFYLHPKSPEFLTKVNVSYDASLEFDFSSKYEGIRNYMFEYELNGERVEELTDIQPTEIVGLRVTATDIFGESTSEELIIDLSLLVETLWNPDGFEGIYEDLHKLLLVHKNEIPSFWTNNGKTEKNSYDQIAKNLKKILIRFDDIEYTVELMPKLELYMYYHSEIISRKEQEVVIEFSIFDEYGESQSHLEPQVTYSILPILDVAHDVKKITVRSDERGIYRFIIDTSYLTKTAEKIKIEIKESARSNKNLTSRTFKLK